jgi:AcrR family transcriptional regulator
MGDIAERAGVSHRSVFRYFDDQDDLARTAIEQQFRETLPLGVIPGVGTGPFDERVTAIVEARLRVFQRTIRLWRAAVVKAPRIAEVERGLRMVNDVLADQIRRHFATELERLPGDEAAAVVDALSSLLSFEAYDLQVRVFERDVERVRDQWSLSLPRLLAPPSDR